MNWKPCTEIFADVRRPWLSDLPTAICKPADGLDENTKDTGGYHERDSIGGYGGNGEYRLVTDSPQPDHCGVTRSHQSSVSYSTHAQSVGKLLPCKPHMQLYSFIALTLISNS